MTNYRWKGVDHHGSARTGRTDLTDAAKFTKGCFEDGWREMTVIAPNGIVVGKIERSADGKHIWWAEGDGE